MIKYLTFSFYLLLGICVLSSFVVFFSYKSQTPVIKEYNSDTSDLPIEFIDNLNTSYPNITVTSIPLESIKAMYYFKLSKFDTAIHIAKNGVKANPFIGFSDAIIADSFLSLKQIDSSIYYAKRAYNHLPNNIVHQDIYMRTLIQNKDLDRIREIFLKHKGSNHEVLYYRYLTSIVELNGIDQDNDLTYVKEAISLFPKNDRFPVLLALIENGIDNIFKANEYSKQALEFYGNGSYLKSIEFFKKAESLVPNEPAYKENIGTSYLRLKDYDTALKYYNIVIDSLNPKNGRAEYLKGYLYVELKKRILACESFEASVKLNNQMGKNLFAKYCN